MRILLTGGSGDLGINLSRKLVLRGDVPVRLDIQSPNDHFGVAITGSVLDRDILPGCMKGIDCVVHIAGWHGVHLVRQEKDVYDFWDLNATGTFNVFEAAAQAGIKNIILISSTSIEGQFDIYGHTKVVAEEIAQAYRERHGLNVIILRPGAFIPYWNHATYPQNSYYEWAQWFWKGAVHINDVAQAVIKSIDLMESDSSAQYPPLTVDGIFDYSPDDLENWDQDGPGTTFKKYYPEYVEMALRYGFDTSIKPTVRDMQVTMDVLGYRQTYGMREFLQELAEYGIDGPPPLI